MTTAAGPISLSAEHLAAMLAAAPSWQTWTGAADAATARGRVHFDELPPNADGRDYTREELIALRPFAIVGVTQFHRGRGGSPVALDSGALVMIVEDNVPEEIAAHGQEVALRFLNNLGALIDDLHDLANAGMQAGYLLIDEIDMPDGFMRQDPGKVEADGDAAWAVLTIAWGSGRQR